MRRLVFVVVAFLLAGCPKPVPPELLNQYRGRTLYTCCNIHFEGQDVNDANYYTGSILPLGTPVQVQDIGHGYVQILANGRTLKLYHSYGKNEESFQQYLDKILVPTDPNTTLASFSPSARKAVEESHVEVGMTKEQVLMAVGYPPTHRTASTTSNDWTYWYNRWVTYRVVFDANGVVSQIVGSPSASQNQPIQVAPPPTPVKSVPTPAKRKKR